jgi:hypothetical protein
MTRLFRDALDGIHSDLEEMNAIIQASMKQLTAAMKKMEAKK